MRKAKIGASAHVGRNAQFPTNFTYVRVVIMAELRKGASRVMGTFCTFLAGASCAPAHALSPYALPPSTLVVALASLQAGGRCLYLTYDQNGNLLTRSSSTLASGPASWGSSAFGCSRWGSLP